MEAYQNSNNLSYGVVTDYNTPSEIQTTAENLGVEEANLENEQIHKSAIEETRYPVTYESTGAPAGNIELEQGIEKYAIHNIVEEQLTTAHAEENVNEQIQETLNADDASRAEQQEEVTNSVEPEEKAESAEGQVENEPADEQPENNSKQVEQSEEKEEPVEPEQPKEPKIDPIQCRVCNTKENLVNIFDVRGELTIAQYIMNLCHGLRISERDSLPHLICSLCSETVSTAYSFKTKCEAADKDFRSKLKRSQNKRRAAADYVLLDASKHLPPSSSDDEPLVQDDDEFKVSESDEVLDSDEEFKPKKKKMSKKKAPKKQKPPAKSKKDTKKKKQQVKSNKKTHRNSPLRKDPITKNVVYIEALVSSSDDEVLSKRRRTQRESVNVEARKSVVPPPKLNAKIVQHAPRNTPKKGTSTRLSQTQLPRKRDHQGQEITGRDLFRTCAPITTTHWSDSFSD